VKTKDINRLQELARTGDVTAEKLLFKTLDDIFSLFVQQKVWDSSFAEEITQDALMVVSTKYKTIEFETSFTAWAYKVLQNSVLKYYRTKKIKERKFTEYSEKFKPSEATELSAEANLNLKKCLKKINQHNTRYARIINLRYQGFSTEEICQKMNLTRNNVYTILMRARSLLKQCLETGGIK
jgi:RNA polymerase sigma factor (sigma-70 family)